MVFSPGPEIVILPLLDGRRVIKNLKPLSALIEAFTLAFFGFGAAGGLGLPGPENVLVPWDGDDGAGVAPGLQLSPEHGAVDEGTGNPPLTRASYRSKPPSPSWGTSCWRVTKNTSFPVALASTNRDLSLSVPVEISRALPFSHS